MSEPLATFTTDSDTGATRLRVSGELDMSNVEEFRGNLAGAGSSGTPIVLDLTLVAYMDSHAIQAIFEFAENRRNLPPLPLVAVRPNSVVSDLVRLTQLDDVIELLIVEDRPEGEM
jgi:anti-anti-sigma factor